MLGWYFVINKLICRLVIVKKCVDFCNKIEWNLYLCGYYYLW